LESSGFGRERCAAGVFVRVLVVVVAIQILSAMVEPAPDCSGRGSKSTP
jgi:hypothetical protein